MEDHSVREQDVIADLVARFGHAPVGQVWAGDDAALVGPLTRPLFSTDLIVEGVHVDRRWCAFSDMGFKAVSVNVSDIAAMGGTTTAIVVAIAGATARQIQEIMDGAAEAASSYGCDIVGGDLTDGKTLVISVAALGECVHEPLLRSGARVGDELYVTQALGSSNVGLRLLQSDPSATGPNISAHRRPVARVSEGIALGEFRAHAALDCSDGLANACQLLARDSSVQVILDRVPVVDGATEEDALYGGEDYELLFSVARDSGIERRFTESGLPVPLRVGRIVEGRPIATRHEGELTQQGYEHQLSGGA